MGLNSVLAPHLLCLRNFPTQSVKWHLAKLRAKLQKDQGRLLGHGDVTARLTAAAGLAAAAGDTPTAAAPATVPTAAVAAATATSAPSIASKGPVSSCSLPPVRCAPSELWRAYLLESALLAVNAHHARRSCVFPTHAVDSGNSNAWASQAAFLPHLTRHYVPTLSYRLLRQQECIRMQGRYFLHWQVRWSQIAPALPCHRWQHLWQR